MQAVLYTNQLEPITVVDIPMFLWDMLSKGQHIRLAVQEPVGLTPYKYEEAICLNMKTVTVYGERILRRKSEALMLFTEDEESALMLKADFLPGQRGELEARDRKSFANGFIKALENFSNG